MSVEYLGDKLKALRKNRNWTQSQLARRLHLATGTISAYETGQKYPSIEVLIKICRLFETSADYMLGLSDDTPLQIGALSSEQMQPVLQIIAELEHYNTLRVKNDE